MVDLPSPRQVAGRATPTPLVAVLPLLLSMVSLCVGTSFAKTLFPVAGPAGTTALRIGLAALVMIVVQRPWRWRMDRAQLRAIAGYGVVLACMNLAFYAAVARLPLGIAIAIEFLGPLGVALAGSRRPLDIAWALLAAGGVAALVLPGAAGQVSLVGVAWALLAALFWALYILAGARAVAVVPQHRIVCAGLCVASLIAVPAGIATAGAALIRPEILASGAVIALLCSALPYSLEILSLKRLTPAVFGILVSMEPAIGALAAFAILDERLTGWQLLGMAGVTAASVGSTRHRRAPAVILPPA